MLKLNKTNRKLWLHLKHRQVIESGRVYQKQS